VGDAVPEPDRPCPGAALYLGDCRDVLPALPAGSFDLVFTDPPYPEISRSYGRWTEAEWWEMMRTVVPECMRLLKPAGSAVFVLQPNSERVGRMRTWHLKFELWVAEAWGVVQDAYWWNYVTAPTVHCQRTRGLMRGSVKRCVWVGPADCFRDQAGVLWQESSRSPEALGRGMARRCVPSGHSVRMERVARAAAERGGVTPYNLLPMSGGNNEHEGNGATTPPALCSWWVRYLCPPGGAVLDPFSGTATTGLAALKHGCDYVGVEAVPEYHATAYRRLADAAGPLFATPATAPPG
jgi:hypothetical protein